MGSGRYVLAQFWQDHHKVLMAGAVVGWVVCITLAYHRINARPQDSAAATQGAVATILPVGGLPVT